MQNDQRQTDQPRTNRKYVVLVAKEHPVLAGISALVVYVSAYLSISIFLWLLLPFSFNAISGEVGLVGFIGMVIVGSRLFLSAARKFEQELRDLARSDRGTVN